MSIHAKLLAAQQSVEAVVKRGKNTEQKYQYAMAADVIQVCRKALHDQGLYPTVVKVKTKERHPFQTSKGTKGLYVEAEVTLAIADPDKPVIPGGTAAHLTFKASGAGADYGGGDKAILKASTAATKYAYANALALPFADFDPEKDTGGEPGRIPEQKADPEKALPDEKVEELGQLVKASGVGFDRLCLALGSMGADAPKAKRKDSIRKALAELTEAQATQLENLLDAMKAKPDA